MTLANKHHILIVYASHGGNTARMAQQISRGVDSVAGCIAVLRQVPPVGDRSSSRLPAVPEEGAPYVSMSELDECAGMIIGSPTHFGVMSASMKHFLDQTTDRWFAGALVGKPAATFTSTGSMHGGQEATLLGMAVPLLHHGMLLVGLPYRQPELMQTQRGGTPYGPSHVSGEDSQHPLVAEETTLCRALGNRVAEIALRLSDERWQNSA